MADEELPVIARFEARRRSYLAPDGTVQRRLPSFVSDTNLLLSLYRGMVLTRTFDLKAVSLQRDTIRLIDKMDHLFRRVVENLGAPARQHRPIGATVTCPSRQRRRP
jgi:hypothetical protein